MPNYSLVIGSKFRPFSYQEMLAPVLQQTQAHQQVEESYATLAAEADQWKNIAMSEPNSKAAETYMQYARDLESQADMLATKGLSLNSRRDAFKMAQRYQSEMLPIQQAYTTKMKDIEVQRAAGPDAVFSYDANNRSIDEYIANPMTTYETLDLNKAFTAAATDIGQIKGALTDLQKNGRLDAFHKYYAQVKGLTPEEAALTSRAMETGDWSGVDMSKPQNQFVYNAMNRVYSMYTQPWMNSDQDQKLKDYIARGAAYGIGTTDIHAYEDFLAKENYKAAKANQQQQNLPSQGLLPLPKEGSQSKEQKKINTAYTTFNNSKKILEGLDQHDVKVLQQWIDDYQKAKKRYEEKTGEEYTPKKHLSINRPISGPAAYASNVRAANNFEAWANLYESAKALPGNHQVDFNISNSPQRIRTGFSQDSPETIVMVPKITIGTNIESAFAEAATVENGYRPNWNPTEMQDVVDYLKSNLMSVASNKRNDYIQLEGKRKNTKNKDLNEELFDGAFITFQNGKTKLHTKDGDTYIIKPGAFGGPDEWGDITRDDIEKAYERGDYMGYLNGLSQFTNLLYETSVSQLPGASQRSSKTDQIYLE